MICLGDEIFSFLLANNNYMYFSFLVNGLQGIRTLKNRASLPSLLDNRISICFNFHSLHFNQSDIVPDACLRIFSLTFDLLR